MSKIWTEEEARKLRAGFEYRTIVRYSTTERSEIVHINNVSKTHITYCFVGQDVGRSTRIALKSAFMLPEEATLDEIDLLEGRLRKRQEIRRLSLCIEDVTIMNNWEKLPEQTIKDIISLLKPYTENRGVK